MVINIMLFILGTFINYFIFHLLVLRIIYELPKAIYMVSKGILKPVSIVVLLILPIVITIILVVICYSSPSAVDWIEYHRWVGLGMNLNLLWLCYKYIITRSGRAKAKAQFWLDNLSYTTPKYHAHIMEESIKEKEELENLKHIIDNRLKKYD